MDERKDKWLKVRMTPSEYAAIQRQAAEEDCTLTELVRSRLQHRRPGRRADRALEREKLRHLARIGTNLNQIARWANTWKKGLDAVNVCWHLSLIEQDIKGLMEASSFKMTKSSKPEKTDC